jgi:hypothetical protein
MVHHVCYAYSFNVRAELWTFIVGPLNAALTVIKDWSLKAQIVQKPSAVVVSTIRRICCE